ncbi:MAG: hypothetical protein GEU88_16920 [Solirubrobacterales bacterium]|nr:hypothetical protein [Solirubrobacterales bacterium]
MAITIAARRATAPAAAVTRPLLIAPEARYEAGLPSASGRTTEAEYGVSPDTAAAAGCHPGCAARGSESVDMESNEQGPARGLLPPGRWSVEPERSTVGFAIRHLLVQTVRGRFTDFEGEIETNPGATRASGLVRTGSIETGEPERDAHLRGREFLDAEHHPEIRFDAQRVERADTDAFWLSGDLAIAGATQPVRLLATARPGDVPERVMLRVRGAVHRSAFGITSSSLLEAGVADRVDVELNLAAVRTDGR